MSSLFHRVIVFIMILNRHLLGPDSVLCTMLATEGASSLPPPETPASQDQKLG